MIPVDQMASLIKTLRDFDALAKQPL